jgi:hypothetical protein
MRNLIYLLTAILVVFLSSCVGESENQLEETSHEKKVSRSMYGKEWPLTVESGTLKCLGYGGVVFISNGRVYGLNGTAKTYGRDKGYADLKTIWADDTTLIKSLMAAGATEEEASAKINIGPLIESGLELCERE